MNLIESFKKKWDIKSNLNFFLIMAVFSLAGMNVALCRKPLFHLLGIQRETALWIKTAAYVLFVFPTYQASLLLYGFCLGQFRFFWNKQQAFIRVVRTRIFRKHTA